MHPIEVEDLKEDYYDLKSAYETAFSGEHFINASIIKTAMDNQAKLVIHHMLLDTISFEIDSLRDWYRNLQSLSGYILLAKDYTGYDDYTTANAILANVSSKYTMNTQEEDDVELIQLIYEKIECCCFSSLHIYVSFLNFFIEFLLRLSHRSFQRYRSDPAS